MRNNSAKAYKKDAGQFEYRIENFLERLNRINIDHDSNIDTDKGIKKKDYWVQWQVWFLEYSTFGIL
ncbi:hypothetical protein ID0007_05530 [Helicobacter pylori]